MIALGADHGGYRLKEAVKRYLEEKQIPYRDFGTDSEESIDYGPVAEQVAHFVAEGKAQRGILCCGTGIGISIAANKVPGIRAAVVTNDFMTAEAAEIPFEVLQRVMNRIVNEVKGVNRVMYDLTSKPPGTIEFE